MVMEGGDEGYVPGGVTHWQKRNNFPETQLHMSEQKAEAYNT